MNTFVFMFTLKVTHTTHTMSTTAFPLESAYVCIRLSVCVCVFSCLIDNGILLTLGLFCVRKDCLGL